MSCFFSCVNVFVYESIHVYKQFISVLCVCVCYYCFSFFNVYNKHNNGQITSLKLLLIVTHLSTSNTIFPKKLKRFSKIS